MCSPEPMDLGWPHCPLSSPTSLRLAFPPAHPRPALPHSRSRHTRAPTPGLQTLMPETCNLKPSASWHGGDEPAVDLQGDAGYVRGGGGEQEGRHPPQLRRLTVAAKGDSLAHVAALLFGRDAEVLGPRRIE